MGAVVAAWQSPCGGTPYRMRGTLVELQEGIPRLADDQRGALERTWESWGPLFRAAAKRHELPPSWLVGVATAETGFLSSDPEQQAAAVSPAGARGIMQVLPKEGVDLFDPEANIEAGTAELSMLVDRYGMDLPRVSAGYNAGGIYCQDGRNEWNWIIDDNYSRWVILNANTAELDLEVNRERIGSLVLVGAAVTTLIVGAALSARWVSRMSERGGRARPALASHRASGSQGLARP